MAHTESMTRRIKQRSLRVNTDINSKIKQLQRLLVSYSFNEGVTSNQYFKTLEQIKILRRKIFKDAIS